MIAGNNAAVEPAAAAQRRSRVTWTLTALAILANIAIILTATAWSGFVLVFGVAFLLISGINAPPDGFPHILRMVAGFFLPAVLAGAVTGAHLANAPWRWRWQIVALVVWVIEYGYLVLSFATEVRAPAGEG